MIQMTFGVYGAKNGMKRASDGPFSLSPEEEARLVARGVAKYVGAPVEIPAGDAQEKPLEERPVTELRELCKEYGVACRVGMTKVAMADAIRAKMAQDAPVDEDPDDSVEDDLEEDEEQTEEDAPTFDPSEAVQ